ncbi:unnamed protein product [Periconia digitata]|uniref:Uncharacterized protein n=1 Tax=Periconia digitata TaxID=1303443 RepID=A0A9W4UAB6_9PLEO|nr:unnamed protein product [Periconia digitata]
MAARFFRSASKRASSSGVTAMNFCASNRDRGSLVDVRTLRDDGDCGGTAVRGRASSLSASRMTDGCCLTWLDRRLLVLKFRGNCCMAYGSGVYMTSMVAAFVDVDIILSFPTDDFLLWVGRTGKAASACPMIISPCSAMLMLSRTDTLFMLGALLESTSLSPSSSEEEKDKTLEFCRLERDKEESLVLAVVCDVRLCNESWLGEFNR